MHARLPLTSARFPLFGPECSRLSYEKGKKRNEKEGEMTKQQIVKRGINNFPTCFKPLDGFLLGLSVSHERSNSN